MAEPRRFFDSSQPQTLQGAVMLCYITAFFGILGVVLGSFISIIPVLLGVGGYGVANERRWGYMLAVVVALLNVLSSIGAVVAGAGFILLNLLFAIVLAALLLHPQSREYLRIWFK